MLYLQRFRLRQRRSIQSRPGKNLFNALWEPDKDVAAMGCKVCGSQRISQRPTSASLPQISSHGTCLAVGMASGQHMPWLLVWALVHALHLRYGSLPMVLQCVLHKALNRFQTPEGLPPALARACARACPYREETRK